MSNNTAGTYNTILTNCYSWKNYYATTNPNAIFYFNRVCTSVEINRVIFFSLRNVSFFGEYGVICCINLDIRCNHYTITYTNCSIVYKSAIWTYYDIVANKNIFAVFTVEFVINRHIFAYCPK